MADKKITPDSEFLDMGATPDDEFLAMGATPESSAASSEEAAPSISKLKSMQKGLEQGTSLGFADEMQGGIGASTDAVQSLLHKLGITGPAASDVNADLAAQGFTGDIGPQSFGDTYSQARDSARQEYQAASDANPGSYLAGNVIGGGLTAAALPGMVSAPMGPAAEGASLMARMGQGAVNALPMSAMVGAGSSNADLTKGELGQFGKDVAKDTAIGGGIGMALPAAGAALGAGKNAITGTQTYQDLMDAYTAGKNKLNLSSPEFLTQARDKLKDLASQADDAVRGKTGKLFGEKKNLLKDLESQNLSADAKNALDELKKVSANSAMRDEETQVINKTLDRHIQKGTTKSPQELESLLSDLKDLKANVQTPSGMEAVNSAIDQVKTLQNGMDQNLGKLNNQLFQTIDSGEALTKKNPLDYMTGKGDTSTRESLANMLEKSSSDYKTKSFLSDILDKGIQTSKNAKIAPMSELIPEASDAIKQAPAIARQMDIAKNMQGPSFKGNSILGSAANAVTSSSSNIANKAGLGVAQSKDFLQNGIKKLSDASPESIQQIASQMASMGKAGAEYAKVMAELVSKRPESRNAIIFGLMQQPNFRQLFHDVNADSTEPENGQ